MNDELDTRSLLAIAEAVVDEAETIFTAAVGAQPEVMKAPGDFATEADLNVERHLRTLLSQYTGLPVHGEEFGTVMPGQVVEHNANDALADGLDGPRRQLAAPPRNNDLPETFWVVDPIDGTANYAVGNPFACILVSLVHRGQTLLSVTEMPLLGKRITARQGHGVSVDGMPARPMPHSDPGVTQISFGSILSQRRGNLPISYRQDMLNEIGKSYPRMRVTGSVGIDLAFTAAGVFGGTVTFSPNLWDNAAGILAVEENGGIATDFAGNPWRPGVSGLVAGEPEVHSTLLQHIQAVPIGTAARNLQDIRDRGGIR
ncbi:inositol monophosphatase [Corynebacterium sp. 320]|uniref:Inositol monophosphatase n=1 Tax=Corynebacterium zhongnanshanii TaxID=2768834 RepID=A0ABQ6VD44_9CORY|nr:MULTISPECIES: inositol monophosphatase [Corynebacterium]KAB1502536.1 inositol monophosphatase [Corynebacterium sp. 320]KAB1551243.1 inositol monophosphatase [Corynebacterium sp. 321]KAB1551929.1 inositol monophosphatase [Corynebacterium sp. 319]KAB3520782.1 inositol monophosphatase [Corynebacterium zhongnanshanii]KAB3526143.1 inositol monophosphatase [Corynebacterium sp. 250]